MMGLKIEKAYQDYHYLFNELIPYHLLAFPPKNHGPRHGPGILYELPSTGHTRALSVMGGVEACKKKGPIV